MSEINSTIKYRDIPGFFGYRAGDDGSIWSQRLSGGALSSEWHKLKCSIGSRGYRTACVSRFPGDKRRRIMVGVLVLLAFVGARPERMQCCHNNGDKSDNRLSNVRWDTSKNNMEDQRKHGTLQQGERHWASKITRQDVKAIRARRSKGEVVKVLAAEYLLSKMQIYRIVNKKGWNDNFLEAG